MLTEIYIEAMLGADDSMLVFTATMGPQISARSGAVHCA